MCAGCTHGRCCWRHGRAAMRCCRRRAGWCCCWSRHVLRWSIGALIGFALLLALSIRSNLQPTMEARATPFVVGSFFVSLLTLALARLESLRTRTQALGLNTQWLGVLIVVAGALVLTALA